MTYATIRYIDSGTMAVEFPFDATLKDAIAGITGATWQKKEKQWIVPVASLGQIVKLFWPDVSIDYDVLRARDEQLRRMFRQYQSMGVRFWIDGNNVACDNMALSSYFATHSTVLHAQALEHVLAEPPHQRNRRRAINVPVAPNAERLQMWLTGAQNAVDNEEKARAIIANRRRTKAAA